MRQLVATQGWEKEELEAELEEVWRTLGLTEEAYGGYWKVYGPNAEMLIELCRKRGVSCYVFHGHSLIYKNDH